MKKLLKVLVVFFTLISICIVGIIGIPMGDPKFFVNAIILESAFVTLTILSQIKPKYTLVPCIIISCIVITGNTISPQHIDIMKTLTPLHNALVLIIGGYFLQSVLLISCIIEQKRQNF